MSFRKIESCVYEYDGTGYYVEQMANGYWDAYRPSSSIPGVRVWDSPMHKTRESAAAAIRAHERYIAGVAKCITPHK